MQQIKNFNQDHTKFSVGTEKWLFITGGFNCYCHGAETISHLLPTSDTVTLDGLHISNWYNLLACE
jgi:hypothetical protein